jgi:hypothetical protein
MLLLVEPLQIGLLLLATTTIPLQRLPLLSKLSPSFQSCLSAFRPAR